ncbi:MAG: SDR family NAD(P)-dependent oxidoreductase [Steroidobacteraceae bacterium]
MSFPYRSALIVGAGPGISASVAARLRAAGVEVGVAARGVDKLRAPAAAIGAHAFAVDATSAESVSALFDSAAAVLGPIEIVVYNAGARIRGAIRELDPAEVARALGANAFGGFLVAQHAAKHMLPRGRGAILFTGATASVKGFAGSSAFAMGKFALRGLAQSAARELGPQGIHVAHFIIDGAVRSSARPMLGDQRDSTLDPDAIAQTYLDVLRQPRSAWSQEVEVRPWVERF